VTVRWDAVVQENRFWSEPRRGVPDAACAGEPVAVQVWLFGRLGDAGLPRPLELTLRPPVRICHVIDELGRIGGEELRRKLAGPGSGKLPACRVFVDGAPIEDADAPIEVHSAPARVEVILLTGIEGG